MSQKKKRSSIKNAELKNKAARPEPRSLTEGKNALFFPVLLALAVIPLVVHLTIVNVDPNEAALTGTPTYGDFFSQAKALLLQLTGVVLLVLGISFRKKLFDKPARALRPYLIAGGIFLLFTLLSALFSDYSSIAFWGVRDRAEGAFTICCYLVLFFYSLYAYRTERDSQNILIALGIVVSVSSVLGIFQYFGHDPLFTDFGKALTIAPWDRKRVTGLHALSEAGRLYGTFFHWNCVGSFAAITIPLFSVLALSAAAPRARLALWSATLLSLWLLIGSTSRAGMIGVFAAFLFAAVFFAKIIAKRWKVSLSCAAVVFAAVAALSFASRGTIFARIPSLLTDVSAVFQKGGDADYLSKLPVREVSAEGNTAVIVTQKSGTLKITFNKDSLILKDGDGRDVPIRTEDGKSVITDPRFQQFSFGLVQMGLEKDADGISVKIDGEPQFYFRLGSDGNLTLTNATGTADIRSLETPPHFGFEGKERLGSARGYIWSRVLPMLPGNLLLGSGPDTFVLNFPQDDLFGKYWAYGTTNMLVDKPHNLYLQTILGEGGVALLAFLTIVILYLVESIRLYALRREYGPDEVFGAAVCLGVVGYLSAGLFNDSVVSVAPVFWILLGVGVAANLRNRGERRKAAFKKAP